MAEMDVVNSQVLKEIDENDYETDQSYSESGPEQIYGILQKLSNMISSTNVGQYLIEKLDKVLSIIETTGKWSLPQGSKVSSPPLDRPLPWIPFLLLIVILRSVRIGLSLCALMIGNNPVSASDMVYFIQIRRRKLRLFRYQGMKALKTKSTTEGGLFSKLSTRFQSLLCKPGHRSIENTDVRFDEDEDRISEEEQQQSSEDDIENTGEEISCDTGKPESTKCSLEDEDFPTQKIDFPSEDSKEITEHKELETMNTINSQSLSSENNEGNVENASLVFDQQSKNEMEDHGERSQIEAAQIDIQATEANEESSYTSMKEGTPTENAFNIDEYFKTKDISSEKDEMQTSTGTHIDSVSINKTSNVQNGGLSQRRSKKQRGE